METTRHPTHAHKYKPTRKHISKNKYTPKTHSHTNKQKQNTNKQLQTQRSKAINQYYNHTAHIHNIHRIKQERFPHIASEIHHIKRTSSTHLKIWHRHNKFTDNVKKR